MDKRIEREPFKLPIREVSKPPPPYLNLARRVINNPKELERVLGLVWQDGYSSGLKHMDQMHEYIDKQTNGEGIK